MKKKQAKDLIFLSNECPKCNQNTMKVVEGVVNIGNYFLRCKVCGYDYDD